MLWSELHSNTTDKVTKLALAQEKKKRWIHIIGNKDVIFSKLMIIVTMLTKPILYIPPTRMQTKDRYTFRLTMK